MKSLKQVYINVESIPIEEDKINTIIEWMNWFLLYKLVQD